MVFFFSKKNFLHFFFNIFYFLFFIILVFIFYNYVNKPLLMDHLMEASIIKKSHLSYPVFFFFSMMLPI